MSTLKLPDKPALSDAERKVIRSALGLEYASVGYRNRYLAAGDAIHTCRALVEKGFALYVGAERRRDSEGRVIGILGEWFQMTEAGFKAAKKRGEKMDREETEAMRRQNAA